jgi:hypothetical protein
LEKQGSGDRSPIPSGAETSGAGRRWESRDNDLGLGLLTLGKPLGEDLPLGVRLKNRRAGLASEEKSWSSIEIEVCVSK